MFLLFRLAAATSILLHIGFLRRNPWSIAGLHGQICKWLGASLGLVFCLPEKKMELGRERC